MLCKQAPYLRKFGNPWSKDLIQGKHFFFPLNLWLAHMYFNLAGALLSGLAKSLLILFDFQKQYRGLCAQDLQEAKDLMLVETADMLRVNKLQTFIIRITTVLAYHSL